MHDIKRLQESMPKGGFGLHGTVFGKVGRILDRGFQITGESYPWIALIPESSRKLAPPEMLERTLGAGRIAAFYSTTRRGRKKIEISKAMKANSKLLPAVIILRHSQARPFPHTLEPGEDTPKHHGSRYWAPSRWVYNDPNENRAYRSFGAMPFPRATPDMMAGFVVISPQEMKSIVAANQELLKTDPEKGELRVITIIRRTLADKVLEKLIEISEKPQTP